MAASVDRLNVDTVRRRNICYHLHPLVNNGRRDKMGHQLIGEWLQRLSLQQAVPQVVSEAIELQQLLIGSVSTAIGNYQR